MVSSLGSPSRVPSHPSIGNTQKRLPTRTPSSFKRLRQRRAARRIELSIERQRDALAGEVRRKRVGGAQRRDARISGLAHVGRG
jgi:hypothetical protein